jgi:hypothetical protein
MSFTPSPSFKSGFQVAEFIPVYKPGFSVSSKLPSAFFILGVSVKTKEFSIVHLQSGYTEADSVLEIAGASSPVKPVSASVIPLPFLSGKKILTLLDVMPAQLIYATLESDGTFTFLQLAITVRNSYTVSVIKTLHLNKTLTKATSLCFGGKRYFLFQDENKSLEVFQCNIVTLTILDLLLDEEKQVLVHMMRDYNTENNIIGIKHNVCFYDRVPMGRVPSSHKLLAVFSTTCEAYQLITLNKHNGLLEWWNWTGEECEAVVLLTTTGIRVKGTMLWI